MSVLESLYYSNLSILDKNVRVNAELDSLKHLLSRNETKLYQLLSTEQKQIYKKIEEQQGELISCYEKEAFIQGFSLGVKIMSESMNKS